MRGRSRLMAWRLRVSFADGPAPVLAKLDVFPPDVALATSRGRQVFVVQATFADGITRDVTAEAKTALANPALAKLDKNVLTPLADGATEMKVEFGGKTVAVPLTVKDAVKDRPISFKLDVMPIFMPTAAIRAVVTAPPAARTVFVCPCSASTPTVITSGSLAR